MFIEAVNGEFDYGLNEPEKNGEGSDGQRIYTLLESGELCNPCLKNPRMQELGIEKISFQVYQLAEKKFFNMDFRVTGNGGRIIRLNFPNKVTSENGYLEFFSEVGNAASNAGAVGLATLANQAAILSSRHYLPLDKSSAYLRCMVGCDDIAFELIKLLCYLTCEYVADKTPGS